MVDTDNPDNFKVSTMFEILDDAPPTYRITNTETHNKFGRQEQIKFLKWSNPLFKFSITYFRELIAFS